MSIVRIALLLALAFALLGAHACAAQPPSHNGPSPCADFNGQAQACPTAPAATPTPSGPAVFTLPTYSYASGDGNGCGGGSQGADPGATADQHLIWGLEDCGLASDFTGSSTIATNCPGRGVSSTCQLYRYFDVGINTCQDQGLWSWAAANDEHAFLHTGSSIIAANRETIAKSGSCASEGGSNSLGYYMNLGDQTTPTSMSQWLYTNVFSKTVPGSYIPPPWGIFEDDYNTGFSSSIRTTAEYTNSAGWTNFISKVGTGAAHDASNAMTELASYFNNNCPGGGQRCVHFIYNGIGAGLYRGDCTVVSAHCYAGTYCGNCVDSRVQLDTLCSALTGNNMDAFTVERLVYGTGPSNTWAAGYQITTFIDTVENHVQAHGGDACNGLAKFMDLDEPTQSVSGGNIRSYMDALAWLMPSTDGSPDVWVQWRYVAGIGLGCANNCRNETSFWPEYIIIPFQPEISVTPYVFNGTTATDGTGCPAGGDTGGAISLVAFCQSNGNPVLYQQYKSCWWINGGGVWQSMGACAAILNTSGSTVTLNFTPAGDPLNTYKHIITFTGFEATSAYYAPGLNASTNCTDGTYCSGSAASLVNWQGAVFAGNGTDTLAAHTGILLTSQ